MLIAERSLVQRKRTPLDFHDFEWQREEEQARGLRGDFRPAEPLLEEPPPRRIKVDEASGGAFPFRGTSTTLPERVIQPPVSLLPSSSGTSSMVGFNEAQKGAVHLD